MSVPILTYHSIDDGGSIISTDPKVFSRQMQHLKNEGYQVVTLSEMARRQRSEQALPERMVVLTFDDGFRNFYTEAFPILQAYDFRATVFLVTDLCGQYNDWPGNPADLPRSQLLSWPEIRELDSAGIEFGSHTRTHPDLTRLSPKQIACEMVDSKAELRDRLGHDVATFAYPYGRLNSEARRIALENYQAACSTNLGKVGAGDDPASLSRIDTYYLSNRRLFEMLPTSAFDSYLRIRQAMRRVKMAVAGH